MARMIPNECVDNNSRGEKIIFEDLKNDENCSGWIILHSLHISQVQTKKETEIDFVIIIPEKGILCVEVKDAKKIKRESGYWYYGNDKNRKRSPFDQVRLSREALCKFVTDKDDLYRNIPFFSLVIFSGCDFCQTGIDFERSHYLNRNQLFSQKFKKLHLRYLFNVCLEKT